MSRSAVIVVLVSLLLASLARAEEPGEKRKLVYVPNEDLDTLIEKHGRGVVLTTQEYLELWRAAQPALAAKPPAPVAGAVVLDGRIDGAIEGAGDEQTVRLTARYRVRVLREGLVRVPFDTAGAAVEDVVADERPALLSRDGLGPYLLLAGEGDHEVTMRLAARVQRREELRGFGLVVPAAPSIGITLRLPADTEPMEGTLGNLWRTSGDTLTGFVDPRGHLAFAFRPRAEAGSRTVVLHGAGRIRQRVGSRLLKTTALVDVTVYRRGTEEIAFLVPGAADVTEVVAPDLAGWETEAAGDRRRVRLRFKHETAGKVPVGIHLEQTLPGPGEIVLPEIRLENAADTRGLVAVVFEPGVRGRITAAEGYARAPIPAAPQVEEQRKGGDVDADAIFAGGAHAAYRYWSAERRLTAETEAPEGRLDATVGVVANLTENGRSFAVDLLYRPREERVYSLAPKLPPEYEIARLQVQAPVPATWERRPDGTVAVDLPAGAPEGSEVRIIAALAWTDEAWRAGAWEERRVPIPVPDPAADGLVTGHLLVFADQAFEVREDALTDLEPEPVERLGRPDARLGYRWRGTAAAGALVVKRRDPKVTVRHLAVLAPGEDVARWSGWLHYTIENAGVARFRFQVSGGWGDRLKVFVPGTVEPIRRPGPNGEDLWEVTLPTPTRRDVLIRLHLETELGKDEPFVFPEVTALDVDDEIAWLFVESGENMEIGVPAPKDLAARGLAETGLDQGALLAGVGYRPARGLLAAYRATAHPWRLAVTAVRYEDAPVLTAFADSARLVSEVARDGTVRTRAEYRLLNADRQFLPVRLPPGSALWSAFVGGKPVKPSRGKAAHLVPLSTTSGEQAVEVVLVYETAGRPLETSGDLALLAPELVGVTGAEAAWTVWLPPELRVTGTAGVFDGSGRDRRPPWIVRVFDGLFASRLAAGVDESTSAGPPAPSKEVGIGGGAGAEFAGDKDVADRKKAREEKRPSRSRMPVPQPAAPAEAPAPEMEPAPDTGAADMPEAEGMPPADAPGGGEEGGVEELEKGGPGAPAGRREAGGKRQIAPVRIGRVGALSLDVDLVGGGTPAVVHALGVRGNVSIAYVNPERRAATGTILTVLALLAGILFVRAFRSGAPVFGRVLWVIAIAAAASFAPAWFDVSDPAHWDGIARGAVLTLLALPAARILLRIARRPAGAGAAAVVLVLLALAAGTARADETVYVPYDPADLPSLEGADRVFVPFARFRELWNAAHPGQRIETARQAPVPWLVTGAAYRGEVEEETARIEATFDLVVLTDEWTEVALPLAPSVVESAEVDGEPVRVLAKDGAHVLLLKGEGAHRARLVLRLLVTKEGDRRATAMDLPGIPRSLLSMTLPIDDAEVDLAGPVRPTVDGRKVTALLGPARKLSLSFRPKTEAPEIEARVEAETREVLAALEGRVALAVRTEWRVVSGKLSRLSYEVGTLFEVLSVSGADVKSWTLRDGRLEVELSREVANATTVELRLSSADGARTRTTTLPGVAPLGAVREQGLLAISLSPDLRATVSGLRNLDRVAADAAPFAGLLPAGATIHSAYRFLLRPLELTLATEPVRAEVRADLAVAHHVEREALLGRATFDFDVRGDGTFEFPVAFPADLTIDSVEGAGLDRWWREKGGLTFSTASPVRGKFRVVVVFRRALDPDATRVDLPEIHARGAGRETGHVLISHAPGMSLILAAEDGLLKEDVARFARWPRIRANQRDVFGFRSDGGAYSLAVARSFPAARLRPVSTTRLQVEDENVVVTADFVFLIDNAEADTFSVFLPEGEGDDYILDAERTRRVDVEDVEDGGRRGKRLTIVLQQPVADLYNFSLIYDRKLVPVQGPAKRSDVTVRGLEAIGENAASYVLVENNSSGQVGFGAMEGLERGSPEEFPNRPKQDLRLFLAGFRGRTAGWSLALTRTIHDFADFPNALVTSADLLCAVGRDGWTRNRMTWRVLNRTRQFLEMRLPRGAELESVRVDGRPVKPGRKAAADGERLLVPLARMQPGDVSSEVVVFWSRSLGAPGDFVEIDDLGRLRIEEPELYGLKVERTFFTLMLPDGYGYSFDGNMNRIHEADRMLYRLEKVGEELQRAELVKDLGNEQQVVRANDNILRGAREKDRIVSWLNDDRNVSTLTADERARLRVKLEEAETKLARETRAGEGYVRVEALEEENRQRREVAKLKQEQQYRYQGKSNVAAQEWTRNAPQARTRDQTVAQGEESKKQDQLREQWSGLLDSLDVSAVPQVAQVDLSAAKPQAGGGERADDEDVEYGGGGGTRDAGRFERDGEYGGTVILHAQAVKSAGLLSLPVTVPERGVAYRFEKLNGGAKLVVSAAAESSGRGLVGLAIFAAIAVLLILAGRLRARRARAASR